MQAISGHEELSELLAKLRASIAEPWLLSSSALVHLLNRFLTGEITAEDVETLADALEMNEAVTYEQPHGQIIADVLFVLSNPEINGPLTQANVTTLIQRLKNIR